MCSPAHLTGWLVICHRARGKATASLPPGRKPIGHFAGDTGRGETLGLKFLMCLTDFGANLTNDLCRQVDVEIGVVLDPALFD
jgi:hypothetical protein